MSALRKKRWAILLMGHPHCLTHPSALSLMHTAEFLEGKQVERRRKEKGNEGGKKRGEGDVAFLYKIII